MGNNSSQKAIELEQRISRLKRIVEDLKNAEKLQLDVTISVQGSTLFSSDNVITHNELLVLIQAYENELCRLSQEFCFM